MLDIAFLENGRCFARRVVAATIRLATPFYGHWLPGRKLKPAIWKKAEAEGLLPRNEDYANWVSGFIPTFWPIRVLPVLT